MINNFPTFFLEVRKFAEGTNIKAQCQIRMFPKMKKNFKTKQKMDLHLNQVGFYRFERLLYFDISGSSGDDSSSSSEEEADLIELKFRNYQPRDKDLTKFQLPRASLDKGPAHNRDFLNLFMSELRWADNVLETIRCSKTAEQVSIRFIIYILKLFRSCLCVYGISLFFSHL